MTASFNQRSQCEQCFNENCGDRGKRNIHWDGKRNYCSRFKTDPNKADTLPPPPQGKSLEEWQRDLAKAMKGMRVFLKQNARSTD